jgi:hypothetical protein
MVVFGTKGQVVLEAEFDEVGVAGIQTWMGCRELWRGHREPVVAGGSGIGLGQYGLGLRCRRLFFVPREST